MKMSRMTKVQALTIPYTLGGNDILAAARTGSGKTLAFLVPAIEMLAKAKFMPRNGTSLCSLVLECARVRTPCVCVCVECS
jgi:ATP-dependent RNA helicase DDX18/HAS1